MKNWREIYDWIITIGIPNETAQEKYRITRSADDLTEELLRLNMPKTAAPNPTTGSSRRNSKNS